MERRPLAAGHQAVEGIDKGLASGHNDVGVGGMAGIEHPIAAQPDRDFAHGIDAFGDRFHRKFHQLVGNLGELVEGLADRILKEMLARQGDLNCKAKLSAASNAERAVGPWLGGSILGSLGTFPDICFSAAEYKEWGAKMLHRKIL